MSVISSSEYQKRLRKIHCREAHKNVAQLVRIIDKHGLSNKGLRKLHKLMYPEYYKHGGK